MMSDLPDGRTLDPDALRREGIYRALDKAGVALVKLPRVSTPRRFRTRRPGSLKLAQGQLGHSNISTAGDIYVHTTPSGSIVLPGSSGKHPEFLLVVDLW